MRVTFPWRGGFPQLLILWLIRRRPLITTRGTRPAAAMRWDAMPRRWNHCLLFSRRSRRAANAAAGGVFVPPRKTVVVGTSPAHGPAFSGPAPVRRAHRAARGAGAVVGGRGAARDPDLDLAWKGARCRERSGIELFCWSFSSSECFQEIYIASFFLSRKFMDLWKWLDFLLRSTDLFEISH